MLWSRSFTPTNDRFNSSASPVNSLIRDVLIEGRTADNYYEKDGYAIKWSFVNDLELIFVVRAIFFGGGIESQTHKETLGGIPTHSTTNISRRILECLENTIS